jgi:hypothetical protein
VTAETPESPDRPRRRRRRSKSEAQARAQMKLMGKALGANAEAGPIDWRESGIKFFVRKDFVLVRDEVAWEVRAFLRERGLLPPDRPDHDQDPDSPERTAAGPESAGPESAGPEPAGPEPAGPEPAGSESASPESGGPESAGSESASPESGQSESAGAESAGADSTGQGPPPIGSGPDEGGGDDDVAPRDGDIAYGVQYVRLRQGVGTLRTIELINRRYPGSSAPEYAVHPSSTGTSCPATEPTPVPLGTPPDPGITPDRFAGSGVTVVVVDTGLDRRTARRLPWLRGVRGDPDPGVRPGKRLRPYAGHGTFIAGVVRSMAPRARVVVRNAFPHTGAAWEAHLIAVLTKVLTEDHPDVISLSAGTRVLTANGLTLFNGFAEQVLKIHKGVVIVAAAGNDHRTNRFWPAASPWTTSVGALAADWHRRAWFTNHGSWVDVYAPGEHLVNAFPAGRYRYREPKRLGRTVRFRGMARWSGTSFSTPLVAGMIAARMSRTGENGADAAEALVIEAQAQTIPGVGAVLLP